MRLVMLVLWLAAPGESELRNPFQHHTALRNPFDASEVREPELRDPFPPRRDLKLLPPGGSAEQAHRELRIPDELR